MSLSVYQRLHAQGTPGLMPGPLPYPVLYPVLPPNPPTRRRAGMGDFWSDLTKAVGLGNAGLQFYGQWQQLQAIQNASGQQTAQLQSQFDSACVAVVQLIHAIYLKPAGTITQADAQAAAEAVANLETVAGRYPSLQHLWTDPNYGPAFHSQVADLQTKAAANANSQTTTNPGGTTPAGTTAVIDPTTGQVVYVPMNSTTSGTLNIAGFQIPVWALAAVAAVFLLRK